MRLTCLVDNCVTRGSALWGEHGLSFLIETSAGNVLWDTGQSDAVLEHNLQKLGLEDVPLSAVALSHAHYDHTGGLFSVLAAHPGLPVYAHPTLFRERYHRKPEGLLPIGIANRRVELEAHANFHYSDAPQEIVPAVRTTGGIHARPFPQGASSHHFMRQGSEFVPDDYADDISLVLQVNRGIILLCGCCHAGLRNTLALVRAQYQARLLAIVGGTHLVQADDAELDAVGEVLRAEGEPMLYLNHCTGERAILALSRTFGQRVIPCPAGTIIEF